jgi:hypothetical protein
MRAAALPIPTEHQEQVALFRWADLFQRQHPDLAWLYAIPNAGGYRGGFRSNVVRVKNMLAEGVRPGYPDVGLDVARGGYYGLRLELKRLRGGKVTPEQTAWHVRLGEQGYCCSFAAGWQAASEITLRYLALPRTIATKEVT